MDNKAIIHIGKPRLENSGDKARVVADITIDDQSHPLWFEVDQSYREYLCFERSDAFLLAMLYKAIHEGYDIVCEEVVTEDLLHNIEHVLIDGVVKAVKGAYRPSVICETATALAQGAYVGTGISCGVDSLHAVKDYLEPKYHSYKLDFLILYNVGAYWKEGSQFNWQLSQARKFSEEYGVKLIETSSNLHLEFPRDHLYAVKYSNGFAIFALQKLWRKYLYASDGYDFRDCLLSVHQIENSVWMDAIAGLAYTIPGLQVVSEALTETRFEKMRALIDFEPAQKYLDCCILVGEGSESGKPNCGRCGKCRRTLVNLDALGALEKFDRVFDIDYYKSHINEYYSWLLEQVWKPGGDDMIYEAYEILYPRIPHELKVKNWIKKMRFQLRNRLQRILKYNKSFNLFYRRYIRRYPNWQEI